MNWLFLLGFLGIQVLIGVWASRRVSSEADYFVAGRRLGLPLVTMSLLATWFGAETCLGASGAIYEKGLSGARADPFGYAACLLLLGLFLAGRLSSGRFLTLGDLYRTRFGVRAERVAVLLLVPSSLIWGAAQVRAFGQVLATTGNLSVDLAVLVSGVFVIGYTFLGGLMGDVMTDLVQGSLLALGLVALLVVSLLSLTSGGAPDPEGALTALAPAPDLKAALVPERLRLLPDEESPWVQLDRWSVPIFGSLIAQELIARVLGARTPHIARRGAILAAGAYLAVGMAPVLLGLFGPALLPGLEEPEQLLPLLAQRFFPHAVYLLFACALLAAILSTVDSILLSASALLSHNLLVPALNLHKERSKLWLGRCVVVSAGVVCLTIALGSDKIYDLVETASALGTAGIVVTTVAALYFERQSETAALAALITGALTTPVAKHLLGLPAPFLASLLVAVVTYVGVSIALVRRPGVGVKAG